MQSTKAKERIPKIKLVATTWYKDSHSLFDYQSTKIKNVQTQFNLQQKGVSIYRKKGSQQIVIECNKALNTQLDDFEFICHFEIEPLKFYGVKINALSASNYKDKSKDLSSQKEKTNSSIDSSIQKEEDPFFVVGRGKSELQHGYKLVPGMTLKLGRIQYYVSEFFDGTTKNSKPLSREKWYFNDKVMKYVYIPQSKRPACKICLEETDSEDNFLFNPCKCNGSCGSVHYECLMEWIRIKVKKQVIGGTQHYNFTKFQCEVCKSEFPGYIEVVDADDNRNAFLEMIVVEKPKKNYLILESVCDKEKSIMVIQNTPQDGIKIGRGHECQIRIADISVSRKHSIIRSKSNQFYIYDNKSKFGTLVRNGGVTFQIRKQQQKQYIQIGRTVLEFDLIK